MTQNIFGKFSRTRAYHFFPEKPSLNIIFEETTIDFFGFLNPTHVKYLFFGERHKIKFIVLWKRYNSLNLKYQRWHESKH